MPPEDPRTAPLHASLARNRRRAAASLAGSPEWDAALAAVEEIERALERLESLEVRTDPERKGAAGSSLLRVGPIALPDRHMVVGTIAGGGPAAEAMRRETLSLASRVAGRREFLRELERLMSRAGFVVEAGVGEWDAVTFYAWDSRPEAAP
jgi:hypothetical protein